MSVALVLSGGGLAGLALVRALRALPGWRVLVADHFDENLTRYEAHGYHQAPPLAQQGAFAHFVQDLVRREGVQAVFPATDHELPALLALRPALAAMGCKAWVSDAAVLALARSKRSFYGWLRDLGLPVLPFWADPCAPGASFPLLGKPDLGWGGRGLVTLQSPPAADAVPEGDWVWQAALAEFDEYSVDLALDDEGRCSPIQPRRRVRVMGGFAMLGEPGAPPPVMALVAHLMQALADLGGRGVFNVQILLELSGAAWISDLNARVGSSLPLTLAAGPNPLAHLLKAEAPNLGEAPARRTLRQLRERRVPAHDFSGLRGLVFDLDDTLVDQKAWILAKLALTHAALESELPQWPAWRDAVMLILEEGERARCFDSWCEQAGAGEALRLRLIEAYRAVQPAHCPVYPDVAAVLAQLRSQGWRLGLLSDNPAVSQRAKLAACNLESALDAVVLTGDLGLRKPAPACFEAAAQALQLAPQQLAMVGDHPWRDARGALDAGYAHAFLVQRPGAFFNFGAAQRQAWLPAHRHTVLEEGLHELHWVLGDLR